MTTALESFVTDVIAAHGGLERWRTFDSVAAQVIAGGLLWPMKGMDIAPAPRTITGEFRRQRVHIEPFGDPDWHMIYTPQRIAIETRAGALIAEQQNPRETFAGHAWETAWSPLQLAYFNGYAMWTYYNLPFLLGEPGIEATEIPSIADGSSVLRGLRVRFPQEIHSHSSEQSLYFDDSGLLRRQDYQVDVAGRGRAAHLISDYVDVQGLLFPTRRRVFMRSADGTLQLDKMPVSIDLSDFELS